MGAPPPTQFGRTHRSPHPHSLGAAARIVHDTMSVGLRRALWWKNAKMIAMLVSILLALAFVIAWGMCGWSFSTCHVKATGA